LYSFEEAKDKTFLLLFVIKFYNGFTYRLDQIGVTRSHCVFL